MKRVRMLLRVSSDKQLEADGDLSVQRQLVKEYAQSHDDWRLDEKEYFEGSNSGYKNSVASRDVLQEALSDARNGEYDILVVYKDDRVGRLMWEIGAYVMALKSFGVDIYTVRDGCISPEADDIMGQMMLALRYGNAQKSSADTGMRVKDTAQKLVRKGKFMGGAAPYGYRLELSGEISRHGRALHHLVIVPKQAEVVKYIYHLSLHKEYGSSKIAKLLNEDKRRKNLAPNDNWKSGTITSILTNPIYAGYAAYKRREHIGGTYHRLGSDDWIKADLPDENIRIISEMMWNQTQEKRKRRADKYTKGCEYEERNIMGRNGGMLSLIDISYCGYCGRKLTNGTAYSYWTIKNTGEKRTHRTPFYRCQSVQMGIPHEKINRFRADKIEKIVFLYLEEYLCRLIKKEDVAKETEKCRTEQKQEAEREIEKIDMIIKKTEREIEIMKSRIPEAMTGDYPLSVEEIADAIHTQQEKISMQRQYRKEKEKILADMLKNSDAAEQAGKVPTWQQICEEMDCQSRRVLVNKLIERIDITQEQIIIRFRVSVDGFLG